MAKKSTQVGFLLLLVVGLGLLYAGWPVTWSLESDECHACGRPVHAESQTLANTDGTLGVFCCPTCALTLRRQTGREVRVTRLTDFDTGRKIDPGDAVIVLESGVNLCMRGETHVHPDKQLARLEFDRCSPSMIAFSSLVGAEDFAKKNGGMVKLFQELAVAYQRPPQVESEAP